MTRKRLIELTIDKLSRLPEQKIQEVSDFTEFLLNKMDDRSLTEGIQKLTVQSKSFEFLEDEEEIYSKSDLKEVYK